MTIKQSTAPSYMHPRCYENYRGTIELIQEFLQQNADSYWTKTDLRVVTQLAPEPLGAILNFTAYHMHHFPWLKTTRVRGDAHRLYYYSDPAQPGPAPRKRGRLPDDYVPPKSPAATPAPRAGVLISPPDQGAAPAPAPMPAPAPTPPVPAEHAGRSAEWHAGFLAGVRFLADAMAAQR